MIYATSKNAAGINSLVFLFSAKSFYQFWMRFKYMEQYADVRRSQAVQIENTKAELSDKLRAMQVKRNEQNQLLKEQMGQSQQLKELQKKQQTVVSNLTKRERDLRNDLAARRRAADQLNKVIADLVKKELNRANASTGRTSEATGRNLDAEAVKLSANFSENKSKLPWPVASGFVSQRFGNQPHPTLKGITLPNDGIDIQTNKNEPVRAIFDGEVTSIGTVPGMNTVVLIRHGDYFTVYARLGKVSVKNGQKVKAMEPIGEAYTSKDGLTEVQFQLWKSTEALDPQAWLIRR
jgi:septal ring factor EnvC (AmiA/AmiB activator)